MPLTLNGTTGEVFPSWTTGTRPASPSAGQTGYNTTLNTLERYNGTTWGPIVTTSDSATVTPTMLSQPLTSATAQNSTSGTSIDFTGIPSWVKRVTVMFNGVSTNGASNPLIRLGYSGGIVSSGYSSGTAYLYTSATPGVITDSSGFVIIAGGSAADVFQGSYVFTLLNSSTNLWVGSGVLYRSDTVQLWPSAGSVSLSGVLTTVRMTTVNGTDTFDAGSVNILYE